MANLSSLDQTLQFLSNLEDIVLAQNVAYAQVEVSFSSGTILSEKLYADASNTIVLYDVRSLLLPYVAAGTIEEVEIEVTLPNGSINDAVFSVMYCTSKVLTSHSTGKTNADMAAANWLTSASTRDVSDDLLDYHLWYYKNGTGTTITCDAIVVHNGELETVTGIEYDDVNEGSFGHIDASPSCVLGFIQSDDDYSDDPSLRLISYMFTLKRSGLSPSTCRFNVVDPGASDIVVSYKNQWGLDETALIRGAAEVQHEITLDSAYIGGKMQRINSRFTRSNAFAIPLATDDNLQMLEQIVGSESIRIYDYMVEEWIDAVVIGADPSEGTAGNSENGYTITYQPTGIDHRTTVLHSGSSLRQNVTDNRHDTKFN